VVWDDEEHDDEILDMTDRVMGYQSFQGASTPGSVFKIVKGWKEKGMESAW